MASKNIRDEFQDICLRNNEDGDNGYIEDNIVEIKMMTEDRKFENKLRFDIYEC